ncbi:MAG: T9SS type A sorting domain-containing protein [Bacteroidetes bacterium]|nr:T9SS type A sorting domain-containing protein [Bacteroidota bacterium]
MEQSRTIRFLAVLLLLALPSTAEAGRKVFSTASSFKSGLGAAIPGDTLELADGSYDIGGNSLTRSGTADLRIVIKAQNRGKAELKGSSAFTGKGISYVTIEGFLFTGSASTVIKTESCSFMRITRNTFRLNETASGKWVLIGGTYNIATANSQYNRIDHNLFENKKQLGNYITIDGSPSGLGSPEASRYDRIDHNHFRTIGPRAVNEMETIRIGQSEICRSSSYTVVEQNLFEDCDGDPEIISVKTKHSVIRYNTFRRSQGTVCLRSSDSSVVEGNFFFGERKSGTGGVRLYGVGHSVINNYFNGLTGDTWDAALTITNGDAEATGSVTAHWRPQQIMVAFNTFADNANNMQFGFTNNGSYSKAPQNLTIANNIVAGKQNPFVKIITQPTGITYSGNLMFPTGSASIGVTATDAQIRIIDPQLVLADSVWRLTAGSPAIDAATTAAASVLKDITGQPRGTSRDVGAHEFLTGYRFNRPLRAEDVGPNGPDSITVVTSVGRAYATSMVPERWMMLENYPNPFNPATKVRFSIDSDGPVQADVSIYNSVGERIVQIFHGTLHPGTVHEAVFDGSGLAGGVYFCRMTAGARTKTRSILLLK